MKYLFFGTPELAAIILEKLIKAGFIPEAVICNPDKPVGRKKIITAPATKIIAQKYNIPVWQPEKINLQNLLKYDTSRGRTTCHNNKYDFFVVAAYSQIIPKEILEIPRLGTIGVHPSLLPKHRGATPIQTAILNGDEITGTTLYLMDEKMDHGRIISNLKSQILNLSTYETLMRKLAKLSADLLIETLPNIENKIKNAQPQNEAEATFTRKFATEDAFIKPEDLAAAIQSGGKAVEIERKIRALNPEPGVFTLRQAQGKLKRMKLLEAEIVDEKLKLTKIQVEGKKPIILS